MVGCIMALLVSKYSMLYFSCYLFLVSVSLRDLLMFFLLVGHLVESPQDLVWNEGHYGFSVSSSLSIVPFLLFSTMVHGYVLKDHFFFLTLFIPVLFFCFECLRCLLLYPNFTYWSSLLSPPLRLVYSLVLYGYSVWLWGGVLIYIPGLVDTLSLVLFYSALWF